MKAKPVVPRQKATQDIDEALAYCLAKFGEQAALGFIDALEQAYDQLSQLPGAGSPRYAHELGLPNLRSWPLISHPVIIFYVESASHIDVWRVLHAQRDIPATLQALD